MIGRMLRIDGRSLPALLVVLLLQACAPLAVAPGHNAIASADPFATEAGFAVFEQHGNAFDAAVAVSAALAVVEPWGSGFGGGGFWLLHRASDGRKTVIDGRERAPFAATRDMFVNTDGEFDLERSTNGALAAGIPGMPAALVHLARHYGRLPLKTSLDPAIRLAREGFVVKEKYLKALASRVDVIRKFPSSVEIFLQEDAIPGKGFRLVQKDLANTLEQIAKREHEGFYAGTVAQALVDGNRDAGGCWTLRDLEEYRVVEREPLHSEYQGIQITSVPPPSSGGVVLTEALNILQGFDLDPLDEIQRKHLVVEAMRRAYRDRAKFLGDPDFVTIPIERLTSKAHADEMRADIQLDRAGISTPARVDSNEGANTTHFSIIDREGNRVAATLSINYTFGSGFVAPGTGVLLNDEMDDFVSQVGKPNVYGLVGGEANQIEPGKRMLSSMTPTFLEDQDRVAILGTPGGSRIISMVLLAALDFAQGQPVESWVGLPRYHHQYLPDVLQYENAALSNQEIVTLEKLGHHLQETQAPYGNMQAILWRKRDNRLTAASDPRGQGLAVVR